MFGSLPIVMVTYCSGESTTNLHAPNTIALYLLHVLVPFVGEYECMNAIIDILVRTTVLEGVTDPKQ